MVSRFMLDDAGELIDLNNHKFVDYGEECCNLLNGLHEENNELKEEVQLLKDGMKAYENAIPCVCTCGQVSDINSEMFDFWMKQNKFYKEHPNRCTVIIDGVRYD